MDDRVTLTARDATVDIAPPVGGSIAAFRWRGIDVLRPTPPDAWEARDVRRFASYPLVPYSNRIAGATLYMRDGSSHALARNLGDHPHSIHGIGWQRSWSVEQASASQCALRLLHSPERDGTTGWPFAFEAMQAFTLVAGNDGVALTMSMSIANVGAVDFPFGLGWHPFFARDADTCLGFHAASMWQTEATMLPTLEMRGPGAFDPPRAIGDTILDNAFAGWSGEASLHWPGSGLSVRIDADRMLDHLVVYIPHGRDFLAIEPVTHMTDAFNRDARGLTHTGTRYLAPKQSRSCTMRIVASLPRLAS